MARTTQDRCNPDMVEVMVRNIYPTMLWMREKGIRFAPLWGRQAVKVDGRFKFRGGLRVEVAGGGPGLVEAHHKTAHNGIEVVYRAAATTLVADDDGVHGAFYKHDGKSTEVRAKAVVLATGGFQANLEWRARYLGPNWDLAKVRLRRLLRMVVRTPQPAGPGVGDRRPLVRRAGVTPPAAESGPRTWAPSGIAFFEGRLLVAGLADRSLQAFDPATGRMQVVFSSGDRLRTVLPWGDALYVITTNTSPRAGRAAGPDRLLKLTRRP